MYKRIALLYNIKAEVYSSIKKKLDYITVSIKFPFNPEKIMKQFSVWKWDEESGNLTIYLDKDPKTTFELELDEYRKQFSKRKPKTPWIDDESEVLKKLLSEAENISKRGSFKGIVMNDALGSQSSQTLLSYGFSQTKYIKESYQLEATWEAPKTKLEELLHHITVNAIKKKELDIKIAACKQIFYYFDNYAPDFLISFLYEQDTVDMKKYIKSEGFILQQEHELGDDFGDITVKLEFSIAIPTDKTNSALFTLL